MSEASEGYERGTMESLRKEMIQAGRKLWERQYVDGNGGNISARVDDSRVICTPSLCSKGDLTPEDFALVDMDGIQQAGSKPRSSEILLHLAIYRDVPEARAVIHCHPPHALAYALTGTVPPSGLVPEYEVFIGDVAMVPYETPGTPEFAESVLPFVKGRNTLLLRNHGIVCWAESVTKAEWMVEVFDTYCRTVILASQLRVPLVPIPSDKLGELKAIRRKLGL
jgi:L-fuculose-phosphate aldolase